MMTMSMRRFRCLRGRPSRILQADIRFGQCRQVSKQFPLEGMFMWSVAEPCTTVATLPFID
jgi:hypothetical protein